MPSKSKKSLGFCGRSHGRLLPDGFLNRKEAGMLLVVGHRPYRFSAFRKILCISIDLLAYTGVKITRLQRLKIVKF
jgi:hypothetical protein